MRKSRVRFAGKLHVSLATMLLGASALAACGETIRNNYYNYGSQGGDESTGMMEEAGGPSTGATASTAGAGGEPTGEAGTPSVIEAGSAGAAGDDSGIDPRYPDA